MLPASHTAGNIPSAHRMSRMGLSMRLRIKYLPEGAALWTPAKGALLLWKPRQGE